MIAIMYGFGAYLKAAALALIMIPILIFLLSSGLKTQREIFEKKELCSIDYDSNSTREFWIASIIGFIPFALIAPVATFFPEDKDTWIFLILVGFPMLFGLGFSSREFNKRY